MSDKCVYENDEFCVELNGREVACKVFAIAWYSYSPQTRWEPAYEDFEIDEVHISDARYTNDNSPVNVGEIEDLVNEKLDEIDQADWTNEDYEMRCHKEEEREYWLAEMAEKDWEM